MPTTRYRGSFSFEPGKMVPQSEVTECFHYHPTHRWTPTTSEEADPIAFGEEVFFQKSLPDGTKLSTEELRYIAGIVVAHYKDEIN